MNLNVDIEKLVEKEIEKQVKQIVSQKMQLFTEKKLKTMGYDIRELVEKEVKTQIQWYFESDVKDVIESVGKESIIEKSSNLIMEEMIKRMEYDRY